MVLILGMHIGHNNSVCLMQDGTIIAAVQQERFDKIKNSGSFPKPAIDWILNAHGLTSQQLDAVAIGGTDILPNIFQKESEGKSNKFNNRIPLPTEIWRHIDYNHSNLRKLFYPLAMQKRQKTSKQGRELLKKKLFDSYAIPSEKIFFVDHHTCHAYSAYYGLRDGESEGLVLTLDGEGDEHCATVNLGGNELKRISTTPWYNSLGYIYSQTTTFLGMKALEHEYKVMGLAPYAKNYFMDTYKRVFEPVINVDEKSLEFTSKFPLNRFIIHLRQYAVGERFDNVAAAVQHLTETMTIKWVNAAIEKLDENDLYLGGGVFMNVKLNMKLAELDQVKNVRPFPSCGDESNPFGACYYVYINHFSKPGKSTRRIKDVYLGPAYSNETVGEFIKKKDLKRKYKIDFYDDIEGEIASLLAKGKIVARVAGRCEWGARSLGNRAILGNPSTLETFYRVNDQIKMRDFWMPFAPTILKERENDYIENEKKISAPYMIMAFHSTKLAQKELVAAVHQADKTCRPQILEKDWNPRYYRILKEFERETGIGGVLNTSFNLHGYPLVLDSEDAIHVFENSGLEYVALENHLISKK
ncbi:MAG: carbamoyltransferase C-terminal domain-containing protein [Candidatus Micrarchaeota archaeon]|nr:carbamoyltransferase C-terminal domain-containing protein [Candidatus Micrarchaeota archaeon]